MNKLIYILFWIPFTPLFGQIEINQSIQSMGNDTLRIKNIGTPLDSTELITVEDIRNNSPLFFESLLLSDTFQITFDTNLIQLKKGLPLYIKSSNYNNGSVTLKINGNNYPIRKVSGYSVSKGEIMPEKICILIYDGISFVLINGETPQCPSGFAQVNDAYCIEKNERSGNFWIAVNTCNGLGYRLCFWSEWYYACSKSTELGLNQTTNNFEWVNNAQNEPTQGKTVGSGSCTSNRHQTLTSTFFFRCCLSY